MTSFFQLDEEETGDISNPPSGSAKYFHEQTSGRLACKDNAGSTQTFVTTADIAGLARFQGVHDASTGIPTTGNYTPIKAGDWWRVSVAGTIVGIQGADALQPHDAIYALVDAAASAADFWGQEGNQEFSPVATSGDHTDLSNIGTNTHAQIDTHIASTSNPHNVTAAQAGADPTGTAAGLIATHEAAADPHPNYALESSLDDVATSGLHSDLTLDDGTNPHGTTKTDVGLGNVPNVDATDADNVVVDPVGNLSSTDVQAALEELQGDVDALGAAAVTDHGALSGLGDDDHTQYLNETRHDALPSDNPHNVTATQVGLGNVDNTSDADKPISTATQAALDGKADETIEINSVSGETTGGGDLTANRTIGLADTSVTPGSYTNADITVDQKGRITSASNGSAPSVFGSEFQEEESLGLSSTNSTTYQDKIDWTTSSLPIGRYRLGWSYSWSFGSTTDDFEARILLNGSTTLMLHAQEPKDAGMDQLHRHSGFDYFDVSSAGTQDINLQYRTDNGAVTAFIQRARIELWRVS